MKPPTSPQKELPKLIDLRQQILVLLERGIDCPTSFGGLTVYEAGDYDVLTDSIDEALKQAYEFALSSSREELVVKLEGMKKSHTKGCYYMMDGGYKRSDCDCGTRERNDTVDEIILLLSKK